ncbi:hypothetical protein [Coxiella-like endosymbiont]|uniref:hypothetical protein n=1 Tax=Coxiella-like endosymbiont TaxID=1592897 RepID=UPI00272BBB2A|nr:hypothetical protein [Coxiella-like endosymbiont]
MKQKALNGFSNNTDLAEMLMHRHHLDYTMAHRIVGKAVRQLINDGSNYVTLEILNEAAASLNINCMITLEEFELVTDPYQIVAS